MKKYLFILAIGMATMGAMAQSGNKQSLEVKGKCGMCKSRIERTALEVEGVKEAKWDSKSQTLWVDGAKTVDMSKVSHALAKKGHDTKLHKAESEVYSKLPGCCKYSR